MTYILFIALFQFAVLLLLLLTSGKLKNTERIIALFFSFAIAHFLLKFLILTVFHRVDLFTNLTTCFTLGYGPILYLYILKFYNLKQTLKNWIHFLVFFLASAVYIYLILFSFLYNQIPETLLFYYRISTILAYYLSITTYCILNLRIIYKNRHRYQGFEWKRLFIINLLLFIPPIISFALGALLSSEANEHFIPRSIIYISLISISVLLMQHLYILNKKKEVLRKKEITSGKYYKSALSDEQLKRIAEQLETYTKNSKPWLNEDLSLEVLSKKAGIPKHHLTQVLNSYYHKNFYQYINKFRVEKAKEIIMETNSKKSFIDIAHECGFNSKSSFNRYFKSFTQQTPSEFKKKALAS